MDLAETLSKQLYLYLPNILSLEERQQYTETILRLKNEEKLTKESDTRYYRNSYGIASFPLFEDLLQKLTPIFKEKFRLAGLKPANSYCRIYSNGSILGRHLDRQGLDLSISISLFSDLKDSWPLFLKTLDGKIAAFDIKPGDGVLLHGRRLEHWRESLVCDKDQKIVQLFLHWTY